MNALRGIVSVGIVVAIAAFIGVWLSVESRAEVPAKSALTGGWTLNKELSDQPPERGDEGGQPPRGRGNGAGFGRGRGGFGRGGMGGGGMGRDGGRTNSDDMARQRDAMRDITQPSAHLTITETESMIVITAADGRTTRLSADGKKVKDENTKIERKTKWDGEKLVSEISGIGPGKMTQSFAVDPEHHQLRITVQMDGGRGQPRTITHVYDADVR